jgi:hypothetical protein
VRNFYEKSIFWWPAVLRLFLFSLVTSGGVLLAQLDGKVSEDFAKYGWVEWVKFSGPIAAAFLGTIIAFLDQTMGKLREQSETAVWEKGQTI